ncbi:MULTISPECIES: hypothetical protein [unclassified Gilliamella]|uniref:hypothetical protein n=1 Tax=unclassified Gilliamella TaxID=2685620 RepID=UPI00226A1E7F|nr:MULTISPECIES: hypothetical protein [unclassified Gilliamella]MCX8596374.1 hypothetical protein [Gilliamella sp. B3493]MCX8599172.1 hypothetical protein [Gilliamella sp. B3486]MCX8689458.1 hypothetical protein [Gilliamella sp. B2973]MCX8705159.1 hypothetical protein [Gilliamella sp. B3127]
MDIASVILTLISVIVGGYATYLAQSNIDKNNRKSEAGSLLNTIKSEIKTALILIKERGLWKMSFKWF